MGRSPAYALSYCRRSLRINEDLCPRVVKTLEDVLLHWIPQPWWLIYWIWPAASRKPACIFTEQERKLHNLTVARVAPVARGCARYIGSP